MDSSPRTEPTDAAGFAPPADALRASEARYRALATASAEVIYRMSPDWREMRRLDGRGFLADTPEPTDTWLEQYILPDDRVRVMTAIEEAIRLKHVFELEHRVVRADGTTGWAFSRAVPLLDDAGEIVEWIGAASDITTRKEVEAALSSELAATRALHELSSAALESADVNEVLEAALDATMALHHADFGNVQLYDPATATLRIAAQRGFTSEFLDHFARVDARDASACGLALAGRNRKIVTDVDADPAYEPHRDAARSAGYRAVQSTPLLSASGEPLGMLSTHFRAPRQFTESEERQTDLVAREIVRAIERTRAQVALRESEARLRRMMNVDGVGMLLFEEALGTLLDVNDAFLRMTGYTRAQIAARALDWRVLTPPEHMAMSEEQMAGLHETGRIGPYEKEYLRADGSRSWLLVAGSALGDGTVVEYCVDINDHKRAEASLHVTQRRLEEALATGRMAYWEWDRTTDSTVASASMDDLFGLLPGDHIESTGRRIALVHAEDRERYGALVEKAAARRQGWNTAFRIVRPRDGAVIWVEERATVTRDPITGATHTTGMVWDVSVRKRAEAVAEIERVAHERDAQRRQLVLAEEEERRRLARELHDEAGQHLTALGLGLQALANVATPGSEIDRRTTELRGLANTLALEMHAIAVRLRPRALDDFGLEAALAAYAEEWTRHAGIEIDLHAAIGASRLPNAVETAIYRVVQEALTNVARHSGANHAGVVVERRSGHVIAVLEDDGHGFRVPDTPNGQGEESAGLGLLGIRERVALLGGTLDVESSPGSGTTLFVRIPLADMAGGGNGGLTQSLTSLHLKARE